MKIKEMKDICKPLNIMVECRWSDGFQVAAKDEKTIKDGLEPLGFEVKGIGIGRDYNRNVVILYAEKNDTIYCPDCGDRILGAGHCYNPHC